MSGAVQHGTYQIVHRRVDHHESFLAVVFHVKHAREQHTGGAHESAAGLDDQAAPERSDDFGESFRVRRCWQRRFIGVADAETATDVDTFETNSVVGEIAHVRRKARERLPVWFHAKDLRAKMRGDAAPGDPRRSLVDQIQIARRAPGHAEFVFVRTGGDMRVPAGEHVRIHAHSHARPRAARGNVAR